MGVSLTDPVALMRLKRLDLRVRMVVEGFWKGLHRSPAHGFSVAFSEYRPYVAGDDPRFVDWRVYARTDRHYIRRFEDETNLRAYLMVDQSGSMSYGSGPVRKSDYAAILAGTLAQFLASQRDAVGLTTFHEGVAEHIPARHRPGHLRRIFGALEKGCTGVGTNLPGLLRRAPNLLRKRGLVLLISDFFAPAEELAPGLKALRARGHEVVLVQVVDPAEEAFPFEKAVSFRDLETGRELFVDGKAQREAYGRRWAAHRAQLDRMAKGAGMTWISMNTERPVELALWEFVSGRKAGWERSSKRRQR